MIPLLIGVIPHSPGVTIGTRPKATVRCQHGPCHHCPKPIHRRSASRAVSKILAHSSFKKGRSVAKTLRCGASGTVCKDGCLADAQVREEPASWVDGGIPWGLCHVEEQVCGCSATYGLRDEDACLLAYDNMVDCSNSTFDDLSRRWYMF
jgi:hypothetical protein